MDPNTPSTSNAGVAPVPTTAHPPRYSKFTQQELPAWKPLLTPKMVMVVFMVVAVIFIPIGLVTLMASNKVVEIVERYDIACLPGLNTREERIKHIQDYTKDKSCARQLKVSRHMKAPIYIYYQLDNFYQNHRRYVKSRSDPQLRGINLLDVTGCAPQDFLPNGSVIVPCGLIAWSFFNDTYSFKIGGQDVVVNKKGISWKTDRNDKFGRNIFPANFPNNIGAAQNLFVGGGKLDPSVPLNQNEDFMVWMRTAAWPSFRKLWGKFERDLQVGEVIDVAISNSYNVYSFNGKKKLVLSTTTWLGGRNPTLGVSYLVVGCTSIIFAFIYFTAHHRNPRPLGDLSYLSWNKKEGAMLPPKLSWA